MKRTAKNYVENLKTFDRSLSLPHYYLAELIQFIETISKTFTQRVIIMSISMMHKHMSFQDLFCGIIFAIIDLFLLEDFQSLTFFKRHAKRYVTFLTGPKTDEVKIRSLDMVV